MIERRTFLTYLISLPFTLQTYAKDKKNELIFSSFKKKGHKYGFSIFNLENQTIQNIETKFLIHSFVYNKSSNILIGLEKNGPNICFITANKVGHISYYKLEENMHFYGHGIINKENQLVATAYNTKTNQHGIANINLKDFSQPILVSSDFKSEFHDIISNRKNHILPSGNIVFVSNNHRFLSNHNSPILGNFGHTFNSGSMAFSTVIKQKPLGESGCSTMASIDLETFKTNVFETSHKQKDTLKYEILSICDHSDSDYVITTAPWDNHIHFWNKSSYRCQNTFQIPFPTGISFSKKLNSFIIISNGGVFQISLNQTLPKQKKLFSNTFPKHLKPNNWKESRYFHSYTFII
jgi:hypothetical protein